MSPAFVPSPPTPIPRAGGGALWRFAHRSDGTLRRALHQQRHGAGRHARGRHQPGSVYPQRHQAGGEGRAHQFCLSRTAGAAQVAAADRPVPDRRQRRHASQPARSRPRDPRSRAAFPAHPVRPARNRAAAQCLLRHAAECAAGLQADGGARAAAGHIRALRADDPDRALSGDQEPFFRPGSGDCCGGGHVSRHRRTAHRPGVAAGGPPPRCARAAPCSTPIR